MRGIMANPFQSLRQFVEKVAFAGLKPDAPEGPKKSKVQSFMESAGDLAARGLKPDEAAAPGHPEWRTKVGVAVALVAMVGVVGGLVMVLQHPADKPETAGASGPPPPIVPPGFKVEKNKDLAVEEIEFNRLGEPKEITGTVRNLTSRQIATCDISFDVTTKQGTQLGGVSTTVHDLAPNGTARFRIPVPEEDAGFVMVRELRTN